MTLAEIKNEVAQEWGSTDWEALTRRNKGYITKQLSDLVTFRYAKQMIEEDRKDCAEKADVKGVKYDYIGLMWEVDKASILNRPYPELK